MHKSRREASILRPATHRQILANSVSCTCTACAVLAYYSIVHHLYNIAYHVHAPEMKLLLLFYFMQIVWYVIMLQ